MPRRNLFILRGEKFRLNANERGLKINLRFVTLENISRIFQLSSMKRLDILFLERIALARSADHPFFARITFCVFERIATSRLKSGPGDCFGTDSSSRSNG